MWGIHELLTGLVSEKCSEINFLAVVQYDYKPIVWKRRSDNQLSIS